jgi:hypothetical protein
MSVDFPVTSWQSTKGPSYVQGERSVLAVPNQRQSAWEVTMIVWHSYGVCLLGETPCFIVAKSRTL